MSNFANRRRGNWKKAGQSFRAKGIQTLVLAGALWLATLLMGGSQALDAAAVGLRSIIWLLVTIGLVLLGLHLAFGALADLSPKATEVPKTAAQMVPGKEMRWSSSVFAAIEWRRFEAVVETLFVQAGFETRSQSHGADGGVDIWLHSKHAEGPVSVVQCKHWQGKPVTVKELREFLGVMASHGLKRGTYATSSRFTADALAFARANGINAQDGNDLLGLIAQRSPEQQARLLEVAYEGEYWKPTCPSCGLKMVQREAKKDRAPFWGCINYPRCKRTLPMKATA